MVKLKKIYLFLFFYLVFSLGLLYSNANENQETIINGTCGSAHELTFASVPNENLCLNGTASNVGRVGNEFSWNCTGQNGGINSSCFATLAVSDSSCPTNQTILRISSQNFHGGLANSSFGDIEICYNELFGENYTDYEPYYCINDTNKIIGLHRPENAHAESVGRNNYPANVCFGDLVCRTTAGECSTNESFVVSLSSETNAHVSWNNSFPLNVCCKPFDEDDDSVLHQDACTTFQTESDCNNKVNEAIITFRSVYGNNFREHCFYTSDPWITDSSLPGVSGLCRNKKSCACKWNSTIQVCEAVSSESRVCNPFNLPEDTTSDPIGNCTLRYFGVENKCRDEGVLVVNYEAIPSPSEYECVQPPQKTYSCSSSHLVSFFDKRNLFIAIVLIVLVYFIFSKNSFLNNKKAKV